MTTFLIIASILLIVSVSLSMVHKSYWVFRVLEYPRLQKLVLMVPITALWLYVGPFSNGMHTILFVLLCLSIVYLVYKISPYTFLNRKEMKQVAVGSGEPLGIFAANVFQENRKYHILLGQVKQTNPDIVFLLETDSGWEEAMRPLEKEYPYILKAPLGNTYGLLFYSRFAFESGKVQYLVKSDIPSIDVILKLPSGRRVQLYGLHPEPPVPGENLHSTAKDKELMKVALKVRDCELPCIVFGDLNDVAWSQTTALFRKTSELLDPRRGRGFYSTFSAKSWLIRFPLDYIFCSTDFGLIRMKRMPANGSDHFAIYTQLAYLQKLAHEQEAPSASSKDIKEAADTANKPMVA